MIPTYSWFRSTSAQKANTDRNSCLASSLLHHLATCKMSVLFARPEAFVAAACPPQAALRRHSFGGAELLAPTLKPSFLKWGFSPEEIKVAPEH
jgi:hypothetical protein